VDPAPLGIDLLVYAAVAVTVISGVDYFFGFRRMARARRSQAA
jgi:CDP-diacylglycerol--glycerol-3-phosphate 3-phosphatidyltransferase